MSSWVYQLIYTLTVPLRVVMDAAVENSVSVTSNLMQTQQIFEISPSNQTQSTENARKTMRRATGVVLGVGSITLTENSALAIAVGSVIYNGSKMNRKSEKLMQERPETKERFIQMGMFADALGVLRNSAKLGMDGFGFFPEVLGPIRLITNIVGIPLKLFLKTSRQNQKRFEKMPRSEQTFEAFSMGVYVWKLQLLLEELLKISG
jgi:hypothetical protein